MLESLVRSPLRIYGIVALVACAAFANALWCGFAFDDHSAIENNRDIVNGYRRPRTILNFIILLYNAFSRYFIIEDGVSP